MVVNYAADVAVKIELWQDAWSSELHDVGVLARIKLRQLFRDYYYKKAIYL